MHSGERWRLGHRPALDGLRGVAVLLVVANHVAMPGAGYAGQVGVTAFFTLSGFLITALLLEEHQGSGGIRLTAFYVRRARRLLPALVTCVVLVAVFASTVGVPIGPGGVAAPLLYYTDFVQAGLPKFVPGLFAHTWSLGVEEQFYIVWPLVLGWLIGHRVPLRLILAAGLAAAVGWALFVSLTAPPPRLMCGPDSRANALIAGCLLAAVLRSHVLTVPSWVAGGALAALPVLGWAPALSGLSPFAQQLLVVLCSLMLVCACSTGHVKTLSCRWLRALGERSYGVYLWHFPLGLLVYWAEPDVAWWARALVSLPLTAAFVELSWRFVERPLCSSAGRKERTCRVALPPEAVISPAS